MHTLSSFLIKGVNYGWNLSPVMATVDFNPSRLLVSSGDFDGNADVLH